MTITMRRTCKKCNAWTPRFSGEDLELVQKEMDKYTDKHGWFVTADITLCPKHADDKTMELSI